MADETIECPWKVNKKELLEFMRNRESEDSDKPTKLQVLREWGGVEGLADSVGSDAKNGLSTQAAQDLETRKAVYGENVFPEHPPRGLFMLFLDAMNDEIMIILFIAAIVSLIIGIAFPEEGHESTAWLEGAAILIAVLGVSSVTAILDYHQELKFREMNEKEKDVMIKVVRDGEATQIPLAEVCVGDVVIVDPGDQIPADGVVIHSDALTVDESTMTGEPLPINKKPDSTKAFVLCGTSANTGRGRFLVTAVGKYSQWGEMLEQLVVEHDETPLQKELGKMAVNIGWVGLAVAVAVFIVLMIYWTADVVADGFKSEDLKEILEFFIISITIIAVAVPEGLPLAVTISLAYSMKQMYKDNNFVRHLRACETMGGCTNICSDKTGTLTENRMTVNAGWIAGQSFDQVPMNINLSKEIEDLIHVGIATNSIAQYETKEDGTLDFQGYPTECALLVFTDKHNNNYRQLREDNPTVRVDTFSSARKKSSVIVKEGDNYRVHCKGAPEFLLEDCISVLQSNGSVVKLDQEGKEEILEFQQGLMEKGWRTLALATRVLKDEYTDQAPPEFNLTFIGLFGIEDPIREQVPGAVEKCNRAGVDVRMVTGDAILTAKTIAEEAGILDANGTAIEGPAFEKLSDEEIDELLPTLQVIARCSPHDKLRLVCRLKHHHQIVGVTGDGTNDAPALKKAHVGLSMGIAGTDVAKQASDIVILDDNFNSIVKAVSWGRCIFDNIRKFLQFQLTVNLSALVVAFIGAVTRKGSPMRAIQLLWVNLIMDTLAALALGTEKPTPDLLERPPINIRTAWLLSNTMLKNIIGQGFYQIAILCFILYLGPLAWYTEDESLHHYTLIFNSFVWATIWNEINSRKVNGEQNVFEGIWTNWIFLGVIFFTIGVQILVVEFGGAAFQTAPLSWDEWIATMLIGIGSLPIGAILRLMPVPKYDGFGWANSEQFSYPEKRKYDVKGRTKDEDAYKDGSDDDIDNDKNNLINNANREDVSSSSSSSSSSSDSSDTD